MQRPRQLCCVAPGAAAKASQRAESCVDLDVAGLWGPCLSSYAFIGQVRADSPCSRLGCEVALGGFLQSNRSWSWCDSSVTYLTSRCTATIPVVGFNAVLTSEHFGAFLTFFVMHAALLIGYIKVNPSKDPHTRSICSQFPSFCLPCFDPHRSEIMLVPSCQIIGMFSFSSWLMNFSFVSNLAIIFWKTTKQPINWR